ncbi:MAG: tetratricopeptide repeat protein, partial [Planctomycetales bacterium]|nr:tetratricopeptide repeat protein [Planctomycetales bacterium]
MNDQNAQLPNSEEDVLNRAMKRMDPILQASLQRDQKRRRQKLLTIGVALMATVSLIALFAWGMMTAGANATARNQPDDKPALTPLERTEKSESLVTGGWKLRQAGKNDEACELFIQAVELDSRNENAWNGLGWSYFNRGELSKAQDAFEHCLKLSPKHPAALNGMGQLHLSKGDMKQAEKYLLRAAPKASAAWYGLAVIYLLQG